MSATDNGNQILTFDYRNRGSSTSFNKILHNVALAGIYVKPPSYGINSNVEMTLSSFMGVIKDTANEISVRFETTTDAVIPVSTVLKNVVARMIWVGTEDNYVDFLGVADGAILTDDILIGVCVYSGATLTSFEMTNIDYIQNAEIQGWMNQDVKTTSSPTFNQVNSTTLNTSSIINSLTNGAIYKYTNSYTSDGSRWYRIAQSDVSTLNLDNIMLKIQSADGYSKTVAIAISPSGSSKNHTNTTIKTISDCYTAGVFNSYFRNVRIVKSNSNANLGWTVEAYILEDTFFTTEIFYSTPRSISSSGLYPIVASSTYAGKLPDDSTVGTYLMAGEEKSITGLSSLKTTCPGFMAYKASNDALRCSVTWDVPPAYGTTVTLTASALEFISIGGNTSAALASYTTSNLSIEGYNVSFLLNQTGIATGITNGYPCFAIPTGPLTITIA